jgi:NAD(P)H-dependent FMN reductase
MKYIGIAGSLRKGSYNRSLINAFMAQVPAGSTMEVLEIDAVPLFNQELEADFPAAVTALKEKIKNADGIIISTPEYNRSIPGVLKNMIDWTSRPYGQSAWAGKPVYVIGASIAPLGAALAQTELKRIMLALGAAVLGQPEFFCSAAQDKFDATGALTDDATKGFIAKAWEAFAVWTAKLA